MALEGKVKIKGCPKSFRCMLWELSMFVLVFAQIHPGDIEIFYGRSDLSADEKLGDHKTH